MANDKIEEINIGLETQIESRNDIDMIVKEHDAIIVYIMEKNIILRLTNSSVKSIGSKRSKGIALKVVKGVMARLNLFNGVDATLYCGTKEIGKARDSALENMTALPNFATLMTREEIDQKYEERRRKEERESDRYTTPVKGRMSTSTIAASSSKRSVVRVERRESTKRKEERGSFGSA